MKMNMKRIERKRVREAFEMMKTEIVRSIP